MDDTIYKKEGEYLEDTPHGNILTGFENYIKGVTSNAVTGRRKQGVSENDRVFSKSSVRLADFTVCSVACFLAPRSTLLFSFWVMMGFGLGTDATVGFARCALGADDAVGRADAGHGELYGQGEWACDADERDGEGEEE